MKPPVHFQTVRTRYPNETVIKKKRGLYILTKARSFFWITDFLNLGPKTWKNADCFTTPWLILARTFFQLLNLLSSASNTHFYNLVFGDDISQVISSELFLFSFLDIQKVHKWTSLIFTKFLFCWLLGWTAKESKEYQKRKSKNIILTNIS